MNHSFLRNPTISWEKKASILANMNGQLMEELRIVKEQNQQFARIYNNACVMRDHYKAKLDKLEVKP